MNWPVGTFEDLRLTRRGRAPRTNGGARNRLPQSARRGRNIHGLMVQAMIAVDADSGARPGLVGDVVPKAFMLSSRAVFRDRYRNEM